MSLDRVLNFGFLANKSDIMYVNNIHYLNIIPAIYNLTMYAQIGGHKQEQMRKKVEKMLIIDNYKPEFRDYLVQTVKTHKQLNNMLVEFFNRLNRTTYFIQGAKAIYNLSPEQTREIQAFAIELTNFIVQKFQPLLKD